MPFISKAQSSDAFNYKSEDRYFYYSDVVQVDTSFTVSDLYKNTKLFIAKLALSSIKITTDAPKDGMVVVYIEEPATFKTQTGIGSEPMKLKYELKLELKKGRYRYTFDNILINYVDNNRNTDHPLYDVIKVKEGEYSA